MVILNMELIGPKVVLNMSMNVNMIVGMNMRMNDGPKIVLYICLKDQWSFVYGSIRAGVSL